MSRWRFKPPLWAAIGMVPALGLLLSLGVWQIHRGQAKAAMLAQYAQAGQKPALAFDPRQPATLQPLHVGLSGRYDGQRQLLLVAVAKNVLLRNILRQCLFR